MITSLNNPKIKHLVELESRARARNKENVFVAEGFRIFEEAPTAYIKEIFIEEGTYDGMTVSGRAPSGHLKQTFLKVKAGKEKGISV